WSLPRTSSLGCGSSAAQDRAPARPRRRQVPGANRGLPAWSLPLATRASAAPCIAQRRGAPADVALRHVLGDGRGGAGLRVAKAAAAGFDDAHLLPRRELVASLGVHRPTVDAMVSERSIAATEHAARREHGAVAHAERDERVPRVVAQDDLLAEAAAPASGPARIR